MVILGIIFVLFFIIIIYLNSLHGTMVRILNEQNKDINYFDLYFSYRLFREFIDNMEINNSKKKEYESIYKHALWIKRIMLALWLLALGGFILVFIFGHILH
jgi:hypothetical protein